MAELPPADSSDPLDALLRNDAPPSGLAHWLTEARERPLVAAAAVALAVMVGVFAFTSLRPSPAPELSLPLARTTTAVPALTTSTLPATLVVHVAGAVVVPGVVELPAGARLQDAVAGAGGLMVDADIDRVNLAAPLQDGDWLYVPHFGQADIPVPESPGAPAGGSGTAESESSGDGEVLDLNTASAEDLEELPGIGPSIAEAIVTHREDNGPFSSVEELLDVRGIGESRLAELEGLVTVR